MSRRRLRRRLRLVTIRWRVGGPEVTSTAVADPELVRRPRHARTRIAQFHVGAAPHAADMDIDVAHGRDSITWRRDPRDRARGRALVADGARESDAADWPRRHIPYADRAHVSRCRRGRCDRR